MFSINNLLLNIFINLFGVLTIMSIDIRTRYRDQMISLIGFLSILLCMSFPYYNNDGFLFDLRVIPLILAVLNGSLLDGVISTLLLLAYHFYLRGESGLLHSTLTILPIVLLSYLVRRHYFTYRRMSRALTATALACLYSVAKLLCIQLTTGLRDEHLLLLSVDCIIHFLTMWMSVFLVETLRENVLMRREVTRMEKMHVIGELAASIAHEIRNPMTVTRGFVQLIKQYVPEDKQHYVQISLAELNRAETIISDYLSYAKPQIGDTEVLSVEEQIAHLVNVMSSFSTLNNAELSMHIAEPLHIRANAEKLIQVLMNLTKNGIEAMPAGGQLHIRCFRQGDEAVIEVIDTGVGMSPAQIGRLGNPFYSTKEKGTGLGLMVSYRLVEAMNGSIQVASAPDKGTRFSLHFPLAT